MVKYAAKATRYGIGGGFSPVAGTPSSLSRRPAVKSTSVLIPIFIIALIIPISFHIGGLRLSVYRLVLLATFFPIILAWMSGAFGKTRVPDLLVIFYSLWGGVALVYNHGVEFSIEPFGIFFLETFGVYFLARWLVRDAESFYAMAHWFFLAILFLLPFAVYEMLTARPILLDILSKAFTVVPNMPKVPRWGLDRVQGPFEHPILYGVFASGSFVLTLYVLAYGKRFFGNVMRVGMVGFSVFMSLSSGPLSTLLAQIGIIAWDKGLSRLRNRWGVFFGCFVFIYVIVDLISNRTPLKVFISYTAFNIETAYGRIMIFDIGSEEVVRNPIFGIGNNMWNHGPDLTDSLDMFWLVNAVSYGLPGGIAIFLATALILIKLGRLKLSDPRIASYRAGIVITIAGLSLAGWGVHFWNATYCQFMFLLGSGVWLLNEQKEAENEPSKPAKSRTNKPLNYGVLRL